MIDFLQQLIDIPSLSGDELSVGRFLYDHLNKLGYRTMRQPVDNETFNVLALAGQRTNVLFCTHMDTVAPFLPFRRQNDVIFGRGACDAKGQIAAMIEAGEKLRKSGITDFGLLFVVGEESTSRGAKKAAELDISSKYVIVGEPTDNMMAAGQKGVLVFKLRAHGTGGHSSLPDLGESAIHKLLPALAQWQQMDWGGDPLLGKSLLNIGKIKGGVGMNVLAPEAEAEGIFRVATSLADIHGRIEATLPNDIELSILSQSEPQHMLTLPGFETKIVGFGTDAAYLRPLGQIILYGPGSIQVAHHDNEQITIHDLERAAKDYVRIATALLEKDDTKRD